MRKRALLVLVAAACGRKGVDARERGPQIAVVVASPGATARELEMSVAAPVEDALASLPQLAHLHTRIATGSATVVAELDADADRFAAAMAASDKIQQILRRLPPGLRPEVTIRPGPAVLRYTLRSDRLRATEVRAWHDDVAAPALSRIAGVAEVAVCGGAVEERAIEIDPRMLAAAGLAIRDVADAVRAQPSGDLGELALSNRPIKLRDVARIDMRPTRLRCEAYHNDSAVVLVTVHAQAGVEPIAVRERLERALGELSRAKPPAIEMVVLPRRTPIALEIEAPAARPDSIARRVIDVVRAIPEVDHVLVERDAEAMMLRLVASGEVEARAMQAIAMAVPGVIVHGSGELVVEIVGPDLDELAKLVESARTLVGDAARGTIGLRRDAEVHIAIDRDAAARRGVADADVTEAIRASSDDGLPVTAGARGVPIVIRVPSPIGGVQVKGANGLVWISEVVRSETAREPAEIRREDRERAAGLRVRGDPAAVRDALANLAMPPGYRWRLVAREIAIRL